MRRGRIAILTCAGVVVALLLLSWSSGLLDGEAAVADDAPRAVWLTHRWVDRQDPDAFNRLVERLRAAMVTDVYVHVGPLDAEGGLTLQASPYADEFAQGMHRRLPGLRVQAWLGQAEARGGGLLDLRDDRVQAGVVRSAEGFLRRGYDGVHYDIEPIWDGDRHFLALLEQTDRMLDRHPGAVLSVAAEEVPVFHWAERLIRTVVPRYHPWTIDFHRAVARHADQIAVMTYDSAMPFRHVYERFVARNTRVLARALPAGTDLLVGVPSYEEWNAGHWPAERVEAAARGLRRGLADLPPERRARVGWALYADWHTDEAEWRALP